MKLNIFRTWFFLCLFLGAGEAFSGDSTYSLSTSLKCDSIEIEVETICSNEQIDVLPSCLSQTFHVKGNEKSSSFSSDVGFYESENVEGRKVQYLDWLALSWACVKPSSKAYVLISYGNGGNCEDCEWYEILSLDGQRLTFSRNVQAAKAKFEKTYKDLGFKKWPSESFAEIRIEKQTTQE